MSLQVTSGAAQWTMDLQIPGFEGPAASGNRVFAGYCEKTGAPAWSRTVTGPVRAIGGAEDILLVGTQTGTLYALHAPRSCDLK
jgi:hypothetical protein